MRHFTKLESQFLFGFLATAPILLQLTLDAQSNELFSFSGIIPLAISAWLAGSFLGSRSQLGKFSGFRTICCCVLLVVGLSNIVLSTNSGSSQVSQSKVAADSDNVEVKKIGDYRKDLKEFIKQSKSKNESIRFGAVLNLCLLHEQIVNDHRFDYNSQLKGFRAVAADRLNKCKKEINLQILRYERALEKKNNRSNQVNRNNLEHGESGGLDLPQGTDDDEFSFRRYEELLSNDMFSMSSLAGGPINLWQYTGNPAGPICDHGPDLVNLIETTIRPEFWRKNGGNGIIEYYQPLRIIVVGASSQVHGEITELLNGLRLNGR